MVRLALHSFLTLALLFGLMFAVLTAVLFTAGAPLWLALVVAVVCAGFQYLISPYIIEWIHKIQWVAPESLDPGIASLIRSVCHERGLREPRFGVIEDGNPNAFTFGHHPNNARVVITTGLLEVCDPPSAARWSTDGPVVHWDFVVMTAPPPSAHPLLRLALGFAPAATRDGGIVLLVMRIHAWLISQYIVLLLSRVREYYADAYAAETTRDPAALATGLVKIAYGLARSRPPAEEHERVAAAGAGMKPFGSFDPTFGKSMALATAGACRPSRRRGHEVGPVEPLGLLPRTQLHAPAARQAHPRPGPPRRPAGPAAPLRAPRARAGDLLG